MIKRIRAGVNAVKRAGLMATVFPWLGMGATGHPAAGPNGPTTPAEGQKKALTPAASDETAAVPSVTPAGLENNSADRIKALEVELEGQKARILELENLNGAAVKQSARLEGSLKQTLNSYRDLLVRANPEVLPELISGDSLESLNAALAKGLELTGKVKTNLEEQSKKARVPAGAPARGPEDTSKLSAREKIGRGLRGG